MTSQNIQCQCGYQFSLQANALVSQCPHCQRKLSISETCVDSSTIPGVPLEKAPEQKLETFAHYQIQGKLGEGGMGVVYKAFDAKLQRVVALKLLPHAGNIETSRFFREIRAIAKLHHKNIIGLYEVGESPQLYYTMEYIEGKTLKAYVQEKKVSIANIIEIFYYIAKALQYVHNKNIIHRDIKPENIMIDHNNVPRLMDFGLAKITDVQDGLSRTGIVIGTPAYMSPEQAQGDASLNHMTDIYSLGATLYFALTGVPPFQAETYIQTLEKIHCQDPTPPKEINLRVPTDLQNICLKCLEKNPKNRYKNAGKLASDLKKLMRNKKISAKRSLSNSLISKIKKRAGVVSLSLLTAILLIAIVYMVIDLRNNFTQEKFKQSSMDNVYLERRKLLEQLKNRLQKLHVPNLNIENQNIVDLHRTLQEFAKKNDWQSLDPLDEKITMARAHIQMFPMMSHPPICSSEILCDLSQLHYWQAMRSEKIEQKLYHLQQCLQTCTECLEKNIKDKQPQVFWKIQEILYKIGINFNFADYFIPKIKKLMLDRKYYSMLDYQTQQIYHNILNNYPEEFQNSVSIVQQQALESCTKIFNQIENKSFIYLLVGFPNARPLNNFAIARQAFQKTLEYDNNSGTALYGLAICAIEENRKSPYDKRLESLKQAIQYLDKAIEIFPNTPNYLVIRAECYARIHDVRSAYRDAKVGLELNQRIRDLYVEQKFSSETIIYNPQATDLEARKVYDKYHIFFRNQK